MGLWDKLNLTIDKTAKTLDKTTKVIGKDLKRREHDDYLSGMILEKFDVKLLKNLCRYCKVGEPDPTKMNWSTGNTVKERVNKKHWIDHAKKEISYSEIKDYAKNLGISLKDVYEEEDRLQRDRDEKFRV
jgi:hypothetical protein